MKIVEIKVVTAGTDFVLGHNAWLVDSGRVDVAQAEVAEYLERLGDCDLDDDDKTDIRAFNEANQIATRFGNDWQYYVEAILVDVDDLDIDPEFDSISDKYKFIL